MNVQLLAKIFAVVFIAIGILGFVPGITVDGMLLGIFQVNALHNIVHILTGLVAIWGATSASNARLYFKVFGVVYLIVTILGLATGSVLGLIGINLADNLLHIVITVVALYAGFAGGKKETAMPAATQSTAPTDTPPTTM